MLKFFQIGLILFACFKSLAIHAQNWDVIKTKFIEKNKVSASVNDPGYIISVSNPDSIQFSIKSGASDIEQQRLINSNTVFHIASLSKQITAAALAHAIIDEKVSLEDTVSDWIPGLKKYSSQLKVKHLVYMTSGLTEYTNVPRLDNEPWATFHYFSVDDAIRSSLSVEKLQFQPGEKWQYSNINYMLITKVVEKAYSKPFSVIVKEKIFSPLKMHHSLINDDITQLIPNRANAYLERTEPVINELKNGAKINVSAEGGYVMIRRNSPHYGGSGVMTSMNDWAKWQSELMTQKVFGQKFWNAMFSTMKFQHEKTNDAFGLVHGSYEGRASLWYEGGDIDSSSYSITFPDLRLNISCFSNNPLNSCREKTQALMSILNQNDWGM